VSVPALSETAPDPDPQLTRPSEYADEMPRLRRFAALPEGSPERARLRSELVVAFLPVVRNLARRHGAGYRGGQEDLVQVGTVGLINAIDRWDPERAQGEFLGFLIPSVRGEMLRYFRDRTWSVRVPRRLKELSLEITRVTGPLSNRLGRAPKPSELAEHLKVDVGEIVEALNAKANQHSAPLEAVADDGSGPGVVDSLGDLDRNLEKVENREALRPLIAELPERERGILTLRFFGDRTQTQIAEHYGISQMHVSRLLSRTLARLREGLLEERG
jgi:RNA polymerase sigma-B factor